MKTIKEVPPVGLGLAGLDAQELGALQELRQWDGWTALVKALNHTAASVRRDMYDRKLDDTPITLGRLMGQMEVLEKVLGTPGRASFELRKKQEKNHGRKTAPGSALPKEHGANQ